MSRPENAKLLAGIVAHPEDDDRRLVYADWLEENGDPELAGFIRAQVLLAACSPADEAYPDLLERQREATSVLWSRTPAEPRLPRGVGFHDNWHEDRDDSGAGYHRGFPFFAGEPYVEGGLERRHVKPFRDALPRLVKTTTLRGLKLYGWGSRFLPEILATPAAAHFSALSAHKHPGDEIPPGVVATIAGSPIADGLRWLQLDDALETSEMESLAAAGVLGRLTRLDASWRCDRQTVRRLAGWLGELRRFDGLLWDGSRPVGAELLAKLPHLARLRTAGHSGGATKLAQAKGFRSLGALALEGDVRGQTEALAGATFPRLTSLDLRGCGLRNDDVAALCAADFFAKLRVLSLGSNQIGDKGVAALAKSPCAARLRILNLGDNPIGKQGLTALAKPDVFARLTTLNLRSSVKRKASAQDVTRFLTSLSLPHLRHLSVRGWPVEDAGARAIAANTAFGRLTMLDLGYCGIGAAARALFNSPHLRRLVRLNLSSNPCGAAVEALLDPALLPDLCECWLPNGLDTRLTDRLGAARKTRFIG